MASVQHHIDKAFEGKEFREIVEAPVAALQGISDSDAEALHRALGIRTIGDLGRNKFFLRAQALVALAEEPGR